MIQGKEQCEGSEKIEVAVLLTTKPDEVSLGRTPARPDNRVVPKVFPTIPSKAGGVTGGGG